MATDLVLEIRIRSVIVIRSVLVVIMMEEWNLCCLVVLSLLEKSVEKSIFTKFFIHYSRLNLAICYNW